MAIKLNPKSTRKVNDYDPVELKNGITLNMSRFIEDENAQLTVTATIKNEDGTDIELGKASVSTSSNHFYVQVTPVSHLGVEETMKLSNTLMEYLMGMYKAY